MKKIHFLPALYNYLNLYIYVGKKIFQYKVTQQRHILMENKYGSSIYITIQ